MWRLKTLASRILFAVVGILIATVVIGGLLDIQLTKRTFDKQYEDRAVAVANVVAEIPQIKTAVAAGDPDHVIQALASRIAKGSGASYVVVTDRIGTRFSHPNSSLIGQRLEEPVAVLDGKDHVGIDHGSLGRSANGKAPIFSPTGAVIGQVSVGIVETRVAQAVNEQVTAIALYSGIALGVGVLVALLMARALKRATFGLEPAEITSLLQDREAMLHGIREGVIGFDAKGRVTIINDEARRLLRLTGTVVGSALEEVFPPGRLRDVLDGTSAGADQSVLTDDALLMVNRQPVVVAGRDVGSVVTLRDRTELESLVRELHAVTGLANALRAQEHEFTNRLHVIAGLIVDGGAGGGAERQRHRHRGELRVRLGRGRRENGDGLGVERAHRTGGQGDGAGDGSDGHPGAEPGRGRAAHARGGVVATSVATAEHHLHHAVEVMSADPDRAAALCAVPGGAATHAAHLGDLGLATNTAASVPAVAALGTRRGGERERAGAYCCSCDAPRECGSRTSS